MLTALADPSRRRLVEMLAGQGARTATALAVELPVTRQVAALWGQRLAAVKELAESLRE